ncbi:MAG: hypothetical protein ABSA72_03750 [Nitrososphaerales archaeon]
MQTQRSLSIRQNRPATALLLATLAAALLLVPPGVSAGSSVASVLATNSSADCYYVNSLFGHSFSCGLKTTAGTVIVVFLGCLSGTPAPCGSPTVVDTENNAYTEVGDVEVSCNGPTCAEYAFLATTSSTGNDTLTFATAGSADLGGDAYDVLGINASNFVVGTGASPMGTLPSLAQSLEWSTAYRFVAAGDIANNAFQWVSQAPFALIPGQPCYPCGMNGGWQASEYQTFGAITQTDAAWTYPQTNDGWAEVGLSFAPNVSTASVSCAPSPAMVTLASTCTATVRGDSPTGTITWAATGTGNFSESSCTLSSGTCSVSYTPSAPPSTVKITASYGGDVYNPGSSASYSLSAGKDVTTETVQCTPSPAVTGSTATCTASVSGDSPSGTITWTSSGVANFSPAPNCSLSQGACAVSYVPSPSSVPIAITAAYSGDGNNTKSTGTFQLSTVQAQSSSSGATTSTTAPATTTSATSSVLSSSVSTTAGQQTSTSGSSSSAFPLSYLAVVIVIQAVMLVVLAARPARASKRSALDRSHAP